MKYNGEEQLRTFLAAGTYNLDLRQEYALKFEVNVTKPSKNELIIKVNVRGTGTHHFDIRSNNLNLANPGKDLVLKPGKPEIIEWHARISSTDTPWVALIIPDNDIKQRKEITGAAL